MRKCENCERELTYQRADARYCDSSCRREASRIRRLAAGQADVRYPTLDAYMTRRRRRAHRAVAV